MKTSEQINELAAALSIAQGEIKNAPTDGKGNFGSYATLTSVRNAIQEPFSKNGLSVLQIPVTTPEGKVSLLSRLMHKSGQWIEGECTLLIEKPTMQGLGSAITYMKRYALTAIVGVAEEDDDGQEAEKHPTKSLVKQAVKSTPIVVAPKPVVSASTPFEKLWDRLTSEMHFTDEQAKAYIKQCTGKISSATLTASDFTLLNSKINDHGVKSDADDSDFNNYDPQSTLLGGPQK